MCGRAHRLRNGEVRALLYAVVDEGVDNVSEEHLRLVGGCTGEVSDVGEVVDGGHESEDSVVGGFEVSDGGAGIAGLSPIAISSSLIASRNPCSTWYRVISATTASVSASNVALIHAAHGNSR